MRKISTFLVLVFLVSGLAVAYDSPSSENYFYRFNDTDSAITDYSRSGNTGTAFGSPNYQVTGVSKSRGDWDQYALGFDGSDDWVNASYNVLGENDKWSVSFWVNSDNSPDCGCFEWYFQQGMDDSDANDGSFMIGNGNYQNDNLTFIDGSNTGHELVDDSYVRGQGFQHLTLTYNSGTLTLYINGTQYVERTGVTNLETGGHEFSIGKRFDGSSGLHFDGSMDQFHVFNNKELNSTEVQSLYENDTIGSVSGSTGSDNSGSSNFDVAYNYSEEDGDISEYSKDTGQFDINSTTVEYGSYSISGYSGGNFHQIFRDIETGNYTNISLGAVRWEGDVGGATLYLSNQSTSSAGNTQVKYDFSGLAESTWHNVSIRDIDLQAETFDVYVNGDIQVDDKSFSKSTSSLGRVWLGINSPGGGGYGFWDTNFRDGTTSTSTGSIKIRDEGRPLTDSLLFKYNNSDSSVEHATDFLSDSDNYSEILEPLYDGGSLDGNDNWRGRGGGFDRINSTHFGLITRDRTETERGGRVSMSIAHEDSLMQKSAWKEIWVVKNSYTNVDITSFEWGQYRSYEGKNRLYISAVDNDGSSPSGNSKWFIFSVKSDTLQGLGDQLNDTSNWNMILSSGDHQEKDPYVFQLGNSSNNEYGIVYDQDISDGHRVIKADSPSFSSYSDMGVNFISKYRDNFPTADQNNVGFMTYQNGTYIYTGVARDNATDDGKENDVFWWHAVSDSLDGSWNFTDRQLVFEDWAGSKNGNARYMDMYEGENHTYMGIEWDHDNDGINKSYVMFEYDNVSKLYETSDTTIPSITIESPKNQTYSSSSVDLNVTSTEVANYTHNVEKRDGTTVISNTTNNEDDKDLNVTLSGLPDDELTVNVWAEDSAGNTGYKSQDFTVDTTNPSISYQTGTTSSGTYTDQDWIFINVSASDNINLASVTQDFNGTNSSFANSGGGYYWENHTNLQNGNYTINTYASDAAGNTVSTGSRDIELDNPVPAFNQFSIETETDWKQGSFTNTTGKNGALNLLWGGTDGNQEMVARISENAESKLVQYDFSTNSYSTIFSAGTSDTNNREIGEPVDINHDGYTDVPFIDADSNDLKYYNSKLDTVNDTGVDAKGLSGIADVGNDGDQDLFIHIASNDNIGYYDLGADSITDTGISATSGGMTQIGYPGDFNDYAGVDIPINCNSGTDLCYRDLGSASESLDYIESGSSQLGFENDADANIDSTSKVYGENSIEIISDSGNSYYNPVSKEMSTALDQDGAVFKGSVMIPSTTGSGGFGGDEVTLRLEEKGDDATSIVGIDFEGDGTEVTETWNSETLLNSWETGVVYDLTVELDFSNNEYDLTLEGDGEKVTKENLAFSGDGANAFDAGRVIMFVDSSDSSTSWNAYFDEYTYSPNTQSAQTNLISSGNTFEYFSGFTDSSSNTAGKELNYIDSGSLNWINRAGTIGNSGVSSIEGISETDDYDGDGNEETPIIYNTGSQRNIEFFDFGSLSTTKLINDVGFNDIGGSADFDRRDSGSYTSKVFSYSQKQVWNNLSLEGLSRPGSSTVDVIVETSNDGFSTINESTTISNSELSDGTANYSLSSLSSATTDIRLKLDYVSGSGPEVDNITVHSETENRPPKINEQDIHWKGLGGSESKKLIYDISDPDGDDIFSHNSPPSGSESAFSNSTYEITGFNDVFDYVAQVEDSRSQVGSINSNFSLVKTHDFYTGDNDYVNNESHQKVNASVELNIRGDPSIYSISAVNPDSTRQVVTDGNTSTGSETTGVVSTSWEWVVNRVKTQSFSTEKDTSKTSTIDTQYLVRNKQINNTINADFNQLEVEPVNPSLGSCSNCNKRNVSISGNSATNVSFNSSGDFLKDEKEFDFSPSADSVTLGVNYLGNRDFQVNETGGFNWKQINITNSITEPASCSQNNASTIDIDSNTFSNYSVEFSCNPGSIGNPTQKVNNISDGERVWINSTDMVINSNETSDTEIAIRTEKDQWQYNGEYDGGSLEAFVEGINTEETGELNITDTGAYFRIEVGDIQNSTLYTDDSEWSITYTKTESGTPISGGGGGGGSEPTTDDQTVYFGQAQTTEGLETFNIEFGTETVRNLTITNTVQEDLTVNLNTGSEPICQYIDVRTSLNDGDWGSSGTYQVPAATINNLGTQQDTTVDTQIRFNVPNRTVLEDTGITDYTCSFETASSYGMAEPLNLRVEQGFSLGRFLEELNLIQDYCFETGSLTGNFTGDQVEKGQEVCLPIPSPVGGAGLAVMGFIGFIYRRRTG
jgi:hypothetical protein